MFDHHSDPEGEPRDEAERLDRLQGASGGAVQAANVALGLDETAGLPLVGLYP